MLSHNLDAAPLKKDIQLKKISSKLSEKDFKQFEWDNINQTLNCLNKKLIPEDFVHLDWKNIFTTLKSLSQTLSKEEFYEKFFVKEAICLIIMQLEIDRKMLPQQNKKMDNKYNDIKISTCGFYALRKKSSLDKKTLFDYRIAQTMYPDQGKKQSHISYRKLITKLSWIYKQQQKIYNPQDENHDYENINIKSLNKKLIEQDFEKFEWKNIQPTLEDLNKKLLPEDFKQLSWKSICTTLKRLSIHLTSEDFYKSYYVKGSFCLTIMQLEKDRDILTIQNNNKLISDCGFYISRKKSNLHKKKLFGNRIALELYKNIDGDATGEKKSLIQYKKLISNLSSKYKKYKKSKGDQSDYKNMDEIFESLNKTLTDKYLQNFEWKNINSTIENLSKKITAPELEKINWKKICSRLKSLRDQLSLEEFNKIPFVKASVCALIIQLKKERKMLIQMNNEKNKFVLKDKNIKISDCGVYAPRSGSSLDKKTKICRIISTEIYLDEKNNNIGSHIPYGVLIARLREIYMQQQEQLEYKKKIQKIAVFKSCPIAQQQVKDKSFSKEILNPEAMPVNVAPLEEFKDLFDYVKSNQPIRVEHKDDMGEYQKFKRGAIYTDGRIDLCKQVVGPDWIGNLLDSIAYNPEIKHFLLGNNIIGLPGAKAIANFLALPDRKSRIETWYLAGNAIDTKGIRIICDALKEDTDMKHFWLKRNPLHAEGMKPIAELLEVHPNIETLDLHNTAVFDEGMEYLVEGLRYNKSLRHLYIDANGITAKGIKPLANYFKTRKEIGVTSLWLSMNRLQDEGISILLDSLKSYPYLERLCIGSNRSSSKLGEMIYNTLSDHKNLIMLNLGVYKSTADMGELNNELSTEGAFYMSKFIIKNKSVKSLNLSYTNIPEIGMQKIAHALTQNNIILYLLYTQGSSISNEITKKINNKLKQNNQGKHPDDISRFVNHSKTVQLIDSIYRNNPKMAA